MILVGSQRGGAMNLAQHLMKDENDHVEVHELRGFASGTLSEALTEAYAVSRGTRCDRFLYSLSVNPPPGEKVGTDDLIAAIDRAEEGLGLTGQPRAIVFHEKNGRRHAHAVWSRIDVERMKAVQLSYDHKKLNSVSRELFLEHGWIMPEGLAVSEKRDPRNFTLAEWQQAKRIGKDPREIKTAIQDAWAISDSRAAFTHALAERAYMLARGDRRSFVALDTEGEVYSVPKMIGEPTRVIRNRLGDPADLPGVDEARERIAREMLGALSRFDRELDAERQVTAQAFETRRRRLAERQRTERQRLEQEQRKREAAAIQARQARFRRGLKGLWDRLRGEHRRVQEQIERETALARKHDRAAKDTLIFRQLEERKHLAAFVRSLREDFSRRRSEIQHERHRYQAFSPSRGPGPER